MGLDTFCDDVPAGQTWSPLSHGFLSICFMQVFLVLPLHLLFLAVAPFRIRQIMLLPEDTRYRGATPLIALGRVILPSVVAIFNLVMFGVHLGFDYGRPYQWITYPLACLAWSASAGVAAMETKRRLPTSWVLKVFWIAAFFGNCLNLGGVIAASSTLPTSTVVAFGFHIVLVTTSATLGVWRSGADELYTQLPLDLAEISFDDGDDHAAKHAAAISEQHFAEGGTRWLSFGASSGGSRLKVLLRLCSEDKALVAMATALSLVIAPIEVMQFVYVGLALDDAALLGVSAGLAKTIGVLAFLYVVESGLVSMQIVLLRSAGRRVTARLRRSLLAAALKQEAEFLNKHGKDSVLTAVTSDILAVRKLVSSSSARWAQAAAQTFVGTALLFVVSWHLALACASALPVIGLAMVLQASLMQAHSRKVARAQGEAFTVSMEFINNIITLRLFGQEARERNKACDSVSDASIVSNKFAIVAGLTEGVSVLVLRLCGVLLLVYGASLVHHSQLSAGSLLAFVLMSAQAAMAAAQLPPLVNEMHNASSAARRILALLHRQPRIPPRGGLTLPSLKGSITFKQVLAYGAGGDSSSIPGLAPVLNVADFVAPAGKVTALVGGTTCARELVCNLLIRLETAERGVVMVDDTDVSTFDSHWLRSGLLVVPRIPVLIPGTVLDNVTLCRAGTPPGAAEAVCNTIGLGHVLSSLPQGIDTSVAELPSAAVRQKINIARVVLREPSIVVLEDALSELEPESERKIIATLRRTLPGRTLLLLLSRSDGAAQDADVVYNMDSKGATRLQQENAGGKGSFEGSNSFSATGSQSGLGNPADPSPRLQQLLHQLGQSVTGVKGEGAVHEAINALRAR